MALEIERRFLVRSDAWRISACSAQPLRQGERFCTHHQQQQYADDER